MPEMRSWVRVFPGMDVMILKILFPNFFKKKTIFFGGNGQKLQNCDHDIDPGIYVGR
jgi:hypothetical protein